MKLGIVGLGFVGQAIRAAFAPYFDICCHDSNPERSTHSLDDVKECDIVFVSVPTPSLPDGACDVSIVQSVVSQFTGRVEPLVVKSTVPPGTCDFLDKQYDIPGLVHSPEFLSARTALVDFLHPARTIIGCSGFQHGDGSTSADYPAAKVAALFEHRFPGVPVQIVQRKESELIKYICNSFFATKISFFNEVRTIADRIGADWNAVIGGVLSDGRIAHSHTQVPGHQGFGYGGSCLPKDSKALAAFAKDNGITPHVLNGTMWRNDEALKRNEGPPHSAFRFEYPMQGKIA